MHVAAGSTAAAAPPQHACALVPTCPWRPRPQDHSCPVSEMASVWLAPQATETMRVRCREVIIRGTPTSMGVHPPCPSSPLLARPQVYSSPLQRWVMAVGGGSGRTGVEIARLQWTACRRHRAVQALRAAPCPANPPAGDACRVAAAGADDGQVDVLWCAAVQRHLYVPLHGSHLQQQGRLGKGRIVISN